MNPATSLIGSLHPGDPPMADPGEAGETGDLVAFRSWRKDPELGGGRRKRRKATKPLIPGPSRGG